MPINLGGLDRWKKADKKKLLVFGKDNSGLRRVRLHVNAPGTCLAWIVEAGGVLRFLAKTDGNDTVEFYTEGAVSIMLDGADTWWHCAEVEPTFSEVIDPAIFTELADRRTRNPELEEMMYRMQMNVERRIATQAAEFETHIARMQEKMTNGPAAETVVSNAPGAPLAPSAGEIRPQDAPADDGTGKAGSSETGGKPASGNPPADDKAKA